MVSTALKSMSSRTIGAAICGSVAVGCHASYVAACEAMVRFSRRFQPNPHLAELYQAKYIRYERFLQAMEPAWGDLVWRGKP